MTSNNSNNVNNANGGESGNGADGAIEGVAIEVAANVTGSEQHQAAVNDAAVADGGRAAADNGGTDEYAGNRAAGLGDAEWAAGTGAAGCGTAGYGSAGYRLAAAPGSSGYTPNGPMPGSYGEGSRAAWYAQNAPTQAMNPQPENMQAVSGQNMNAQDANMQGANTPDANAQGGRMPLYADWNGRGPVPGAMGGQVPTPKGSKGGEHALSGKTWALLAVVSLVWPRGWRRWSARGERADRRRRWHGQQPADADARRHGAAAQRRPIRQWTVSAVWWLRGVGQPARQWFQWLRQQLQRFRFLVQLRRQ